MPKIFNKNTLLIFIGIIIGILASTAVVHKLSSTSKQTSQSEALASANLIPAQINELSYQELIALNRNLSTQLTQLQQQILTLSSQKSQSHNQKSNKQLLSATTEQKENINIPFLSTQFIKKNIPSVDYIIPHKLKKILELSIEQEKELAQLLKQKAEKDIDILAPLLTELSQGSVAQLFRYAEEGSINNDILAQQVALEQQNNQDYFEGSLRNILTEEQINAYYNFEVERASTIYQANIRQKKRLLQRIPNLEAYQLDQITQFLDEQTFDVSKVAIAAARNPITANSQSTNHHIKEALEQQLSLLLTPEQLTYYHENIKMGF